ncbi:MAG: aconitate hydratase AcnA [Verrucomicrobia bacterium]|nr:MAG: aconitate hydratase AcnA [Verrucomicrobiota bacterium]
MKNPLGSLIQFKSNDAGKEGYIYSLKALKKSGLDVSRLPVSIRIVLESVLRNCDGKKITEDDARRLASWNAENPGDCEVPFVVSRVVLQDFTGVPLLVDLAAMRDAAKRRGANPANVEPLVPVDLVVDHSVQMDYWGARDAFEKNLEKEFERNRERYEFLKWGQQAFKTFSVIPPSMGIIHQINLERLARVVFEGEKDGKKIFYPDTVVGTDSHTTMINGLGVVGWGVGGIEAESGMLGQPIYFKMPEVVGVRVVGETAEGVMATDIALTVTKLLREEKVVGKFVEFFGEGARRLALADRATIANMAPEYGATMGYFPVDETSLEYLALTGRGEGEIALARDYLKEQGLFGIPSDGECDYTKTVTLDLSAIRPCIAGPKRPQDKIELADAKASFGKLLDGAGQTRAKKADTPYGEIRDGSVLIAAITSCTNTSNPSVLMAAGLLAKRADELGIRPPKYVKTTLAPGSRAVTDYLECAGLQKHLDSLGFNLAGYGCATCIGNSGPLEPEIAEAVKRENLTCASVLSGNRNFEARVHPLIKANYLMSPPLAVAFAIAGRIDIDFDREPLAKTPEGADVFLSDIWPSSKEVAEAVAKCVKSEMFKTRYADMSGPRQWKEIAGASGILYPWDEKSTYIQNPPFFDAPKNSGSGGLSNMRALAIFGDSVTTDHISPAGAIPPDSPAGIWLRDRGVRPENFNSYGSRRGNDRVMTRGTFANVRIKNLMAGGAEGGFTKICGAGENVTIFEAAEKYAEKGTGLIVFGGRDYGMGSSRDWAAKGTALLGVKAVVAKSFERIHRSNLVGMGVLPLEFEDGTDAQTLGLDGTQTFSIKGLENGVAAGMKVRLEIRDGENVREIPLNLRIDTPIEASFYKAGGILPYVLDKIVEE